MSPIIHYLGLDVHKESIAVSIAPAHSTEVRRYGIIGGTLDAVDKLIKNFPNPAANCAWFMKPGRAALFSAVICAAKGLSAKWSRLRSFPEKPPTR